MAFTAYNAFGDWHKAYDPAFDVFQFMPWHKTNPVNNVRRTSFTNSVELIVCCWNKGHTWNFIGYRENHNFIEGPICMGKERPKDSNGKTLHPTQKPLWALRHCIELASSPGDLIYDPFGGVMSTGVAALEPGRRFIGIEIDQCYFNAGKYRMSNSLQV